MQKQHKRDFKKEVLKELKELSDLFPGQTLSMHIGIALSDYPDISVISDKEFKFALEKYKVQKEIDADHNILTDRELDKIFEDAQNLDRIFQDEEDEY